MGKHKKGKISSPHQHPSSKVTDSHTVAHNTLPPYVEQAQKIITGTIIGSSAILCYGSPWIIAISTVTFLANIVAEHYYYEAPKEQLDKTQNQDINH